MHTAAGTAFLIAAGSFFLLTTLSSALRPDTFACRLGLTIKSAGGFNEIRSQYAGFFLAAATVCALALTATLPRLTAYVALAMIFGGLFAGRLVSLALNRGFSGFGPVILALYGIDGLGFALSAGLIAAERG